MTNVDEKRDAEQTLAEDLPRVFAGEWERLSFRDRALILMDCTVDGGVSDLVQYQQNIGTGNLASYASVMRVRFSKGTK